MLDAGRDAQGRHRHLASARDSAGEPRSAKGAEPVGDIRNRLLRFAETVCVPHLLEHPRLKPYADEVSLVLVGSVATGLCSPGSDVDIAIVCGADAYAAIAEGTKWREGRPSEEILDGTQLHYYGVTYDDIRGAFGELDDMAIGMYASGRVLHDPGGRYARFVETLPAGLGLRRRRVARKLDHLARRSRGLASALEYGDPLVIGRVYLEVIGICLALTALLDDVPFDPRKRLFRSALRGPVGKRLEPRIRRMFGVLGSLGEFDAPSNSACVEYLGPLKELTDTLSKEAARLELVDG